MNDRGGEVNAGRPSPSSAHRSTLLVSDWAIFVTPSSRPVSRRSDMVPVPAPHWPICPPWRKNSLKTIAPRGLPKPLPPRQARTRFDARRLLWTTSHAPRRRGHSDAAFKEPARRKHCWKPPKPSCQEDPEVPPPLGPDENSYFNNPGRLWPAGGRPGQDGNQPCLLRLLRHLDHTTTDEAWLPVLLYRDVQDGLFRASPRNWSNCAPSAAARQACLAWVLRTRRSHPALYTSLKKAKQMHGSFLRPLRQPWNKTRTASPTIQTCDPLNHQPPQLPMQASEPVWLVKHCEPIARRLPITA